VTVSEFVKRFLTAHFLEKKKFEQEAKNPKMAKIKIAIFTVSDDTLASSPVELGVYMYHLLFLESDTSQMQ